MWAWLERQDWLFGPRVTYGTERDNMLASYERRRVSADDLRNIEQWMNVVPFARVVIRSGSIAAPPVGDSTHVRDSLDDLFAQSSVHQQLVTLVATRDDGWELSVMITGRGAMMQRHLADDFYNSAEAQKVYGNVDRVLVATPRMWPSHAGWELIERVVWGMAAVAAAGWFAWWVHDLRLAVLGLGIALLLARAGAQGRWLYRWGDRHTPLDWLDLDPREEVRARRRNSKENTKVFWKTAAVVGPVAALLGAFANAMLK
ncbi:hypothetical protein [Phycicoccus sp. 3266]|uniref:hypothetical protein n=1 Tax=Phycicoccus sp. 3266 TaxID=2817751 RepID=UPI0028663357|nr:hypothetical protein [Phycicoccus sp. 3266]MDR6862176.1 hypothetical protein [Phycicoccus sp. 3266]